MAVRITSVRSTYRQQLAMLKGAISKHSRYHAQFRLRLNEEMALPVNERSPYAIAELKRGLQRSNDMVRQSRHQYHNLVAFHQHCWDKATERKIERARAAIAHWAANGLPTGERHD